MYSEYSLIRGENRVSKNAMITVAIGVFCLIGHLLLILASIISIGTIGVIGGFLGCLFFVLSIFGTLWGIVWYDEVRTTKKYKKLGIFMNACGILWGIILFIL